MPAIVDIYQSMIKVIKNQVLRKLVKLHNSQNVKKNRSISTFASTFWSWLVLLKVNQTKNLIDLRHRLPADAFFLASNLNNNSSWFED